MAKKCKGGIYSEGMSRFDDDIKDRVKALTLKQKIGQLMQLNIDMIGSMVEGSFVVNDEALRSIVEEYGVGSFLNSPLSGGCSADICQLSVEQWQGIIGAIQNVSIEYGPKIPSIYGLDSIHGANYIRHAVMFPQAINAAASFNRELTELQGYITAKDTRAAGIPWIFAPILGIALQPQWPRVFETFGEDPYLASELGKRMIMGMQGYPADISNISRAAACMKHFIGYSNPRSGHDRTPAWIPERYLYQYFLPPFQAAVEVGVATAMESYGDINGVPIASSFEHTVCLLRDEMEWDGMMVTDWSEIKNLFVHHRIASNHEEAVRLSMEGTSIDMSMIPDSNSGSQWEEFSNILEQLANENNNLMNRIEESAARVIKLKKDLGLFEDPYGFSDPSVVGTEDDKEASLNLARESIILAENRDRVLPAAPTNYNNILIVGPTGDSLPLQNGGWTIHWQGAFSNDEFDDGSTIKTGISKIMAEQNPGANVTYLEGCDVWGNFINLDLVLNASAEADMIIVALGEHAYTEVPGDIDDILLPLGQEELLDAIAGVTDKLIVLVLLEGRPRVLRRPRDVAHATLVGFLPGPYGGQAIAEIIFGQTNPSAKFPITYPSNANTILSGYYWHTHSQVSNMGDPASWPRWEFGYGLSFSTFTYSSIQLSSMALTSLDQELQINVTVTNEGPMPGKEVVLLFIGQDHRIVAPEVKMLKRFKKIHLEVGQKETVSFTITAKDDLFFYAESKTKRYEDGFFTIDMTSGNTTHTNPATPVTQKFTLDTGKHPATFIQEQENDQPIIEETTGVFTSTEAGIFLVLAFIVGIIVMFLLMHFVCNSRRKNYEDLDMSAHEYRQK